jgi:hypothetical protein
MHELLSLRWIQITTAAIFALGFAILTMKDEFALFFRIPVLQTGNGCT